MTTPAKQVFAAIEFSAILIVVLVATGCGGPPPLPKGAVGNDGRYNYSPSIIQTGNVREFWWCSQGRNPADHSQDTDAIYYEAINMVTPVSQGPILVMAETPGAWDSGYTCNPKVIRGVFENPLGDGNNYTYAMYYAAESRSFGNNSIGVAFSNDGMQWTKYPQPVIPSSSPNGYGVGQPSLYNADGKATIRLFYEDDNPSLHHVAAISSDGVHFVVQGTLTCNGLDADDPLATWGDMAYEPKAGEWYAVFNRPLRAVSATGGILERGQYGVELYKIPEDSLLTGTSPWQQLGSRDTNGTGFESNFLAGFVRDQYGNLELSAHPAIQVYTSISYPPPAWHDSPEYAALSADTSRWILMPMEWDLTQTASIPLNRYYNGRVHEVTTGWVSPEGGFRLQQALGHLYANPVGAGTVPFYGCKGGSTDYFVSLDMNCEGERILGIEGYGYRQPVSGSNLVPIYRCRTAHDHFVSQDPKCEGQTTDRLLGYILR